MQSCSTISSVQVATRPHISELGKEEAKVYDVPALDPNNVEKARIGVMRHAVELRNLPFLRAGIKWLREKELHTDKPGTIECYRDYLKRLWMTLFREYKAAGFTLKDVHIGHFLEYQRRNKKRYHPASVNHDLNVLSQMLRRASLWEPIRDHYRPLPLPEKDNPKVMSEKEENAFFEFASKSEWVLAYIVASGTNNTTASGKEWRMMKREHVHLGDDPPWIQVPKNMKTPFRKRVIPLNERGAEMLRRMLRRASQLGSTQPEHYLFPFRVKRGLYDPTRPASESWLKYQWKKLVDAALEAKIISFRVKPHNIRHQAITNMIDAGNPIEVVRLIAGHGVDSHQTREYHHGRMEVLKRAVDRIDPDKKKPQDAPVEKTERVNA